ncbi:hypothetical protein MMC13_006462 [Lambiella insularis]|nr:hypothetical protein [Lambiella insularis]
MALSVLPLQAILIVLCALGGYLTWGLAMQNGTMSMMAHIRDFGPHVLPGTDAPLKQTYTGIRAVDYQLTVLAVFFWNLVDGSMPHASLFVGKLAFQFIAAWGLLMIEGARNGNKGRLISYLSLWGALVQNATWAMTIPLFLALYLSTSSTVSARKADIITNTYDVASIPLSLMCGFIVPAVMLSLPAPSMQSYQAKQTWMAIWQAFPLWVSSFQQVFKRCLSFVWPQSYLRADSTSVVTLRVVYGILFVVAAVGQIGTATLSLASLLFPGLFASKYVGVFDPLKVAVSAALTPSAQVASVGAGSLMLLQYDEMVGSTAVLLWASFMYANAKSQNKTFSSWGQMALLVTLLTVLAGPTGCAVALLWARDELALGKMSG